MNRQESAENRNESQEENFDTLKEAIYKGWLPMALSIGLGYEEFWHMNPAKLEPYIKVYELSKQRRLEEINLQSYLTGIYFTHALGCVFSRGNRYPEAPLDLFSKQVSPEERAQQEAEIFKAYVREYNLQFRKETK